MEIESGRANEWGARHSPRAQSFLRPQSQLIDLHLRVALPTLSVRVTGRTIESKDLLRGRRRRAGHGSGYN